MARAVNRWIDCSFYEGLLRAMTFFVEVGAGAADPNRERRCGGYNVCVLGKSLEVSGKLSCFCFGLPIVGAAEKGCGEISFRFGGSELVGPGDSSGGIGSRTGAVGLGIISGLFISGIVPIIPAGGIEVGGEFGVDVDDEGVRAPRAAESDGVACGGCTPGARGGGIHRCGFVVDAAGDLAVEDDVAGGLVG